MPPTDHTPLMMRSFLILLSSSSPSQIIHVKMLIISHRFYHYIHQHMLGIKPTTFWL